MKPLFGLDSSTIAKIQDVLRRYHEIEKAVIYGSRAKGNYREGSDIDLTLLGNVNTKIVAKVLDELDESFLPYTFDISAYDSLKNDKLREHIDRVGKEFYRREDGTGAGARKGWEEKKLGEVCEIKPQKIEARKKLKPNQMVSFVPMEDLGIGQKEFIPKKERLLSDVEGSYTYFADDDVLLAKITPCFENGKLGIAKNLRNGIGFGSSEYIVFRTDKTLYNEFLYYFLSQEVFRTNGAKNMSGAVGHKRVAKEFIETTQIPLPPLPEQKRIVAILDKTFAEISRAKEIAEKNLANAKEVFESYLQGVFANPGEGWEEKQLQDVVDSGCTLSYGIVQPGEDFPNGLPIVRPTDLTKKYIRLPGLKLIDPRLADSYKRTMLTGNELLLCVRGNTGVISIAMGELKGANVTRGIVPIRFKSNLLGLDFGYYQFISDFIMKQIKMKTYGTALMQINIGDLRKISMLVPPLSEQRAIVTKLDALSAETKKLEQIYKQKISDLDELKKSILQKAFSGELIK